MIKKPEVSRKMLIFGLKIKDINNMSNAKVVSFDEIPLFTYGCLTNVNSDKYYYSTDLGQIAASFPWEKLVRYFEKKFSQSKAKTGRPRVFSIRTELALIVLKSVTGESDRVLMERLAQDWVYQRFGRVNLLERYENYTILSDIRERYAKHFNYKELQKIFAEHWHEYLSRIEGVLMDATVFKSNMKYPSTVELLWESIEWLHKKIAILSKLLNIRMIRSKYRDVKRAYKKIITQKEPKRKQLRRVIGRELNLLNKYLSHFSELLSKIEQGEKVLTWCEREVYQTIKKVYEQREAQYEGKAVKNLILRLYKPYVRSIYRGKRSGKWEFGLKYHLFVLGEMVWIEYVSNENYNESRHLESVIREAEQYVGHRLKYAAADRIYATRANRKYLKSKGMEENFVPTGRPIQDQQRRRQQQVLKQELKAARNSRMEGVFGVLKEHYNTERVRVKRREVEELVIFFALMSYNSKMHSRWQAKEKEKEKQAA